MDNEYLDKYDKQIYFINKYNEISINFHQLLQIYYRYFDYDKQLKPGNITKYIKQ